jgi:hypothetical protein
VFVVIVALAAASLFVGAAGVASAHQFVAFGHTPISGTAGEEVSIPVDLHRTDLATLQVIGPDGFQLTVDLVDGDTDGQLTVVLDTAAVGRGDAAAGISVDSGRAVDPEVTGAPGRPLAPGQYDLGLTSPRGVGQQTNLTLQRATATATPDATTATPDATTATTNATTATADETGDTTPDTAASASGTETQNDAGSASESTGVGAAGDGSAATSRAGESSAGSRAPLPLLLLALFGPGTPILALAAVSRAVGRSESRVSTDD